MNQNHYIYIFSILDIDKIISLCVPCQPKYPYSIISKDDSPSASIADPILKNLLLEMMNYFDDSI